MKLLSAPVQKKMEQKRRDATKKRVAEHRQRKKEAAMQAKEHAPFSSAMSFAKATARAQRMMNTALPSTPRRRDAICRKLYATQTGEAPREPSTTQTRSSALNEEVVNKVVNYYQRDDVSRQAPGRKDATNVRMADGTKTKVQTRHLTSSVLETYAMFCEEEPNCKLGKSKFAELRSKHVQLSSKLPHNVCLCKYHENLIAAIESLHKAIPEFPPYSQSLPLTFLCENVMHNCWIDACDVCSAGQGFISTYAGVLQEEGAASWYVWKNDADNKLCKVLEEGTTNDLQQHILSTEFAALELADRVITSMDHNETPINIYLDLSKAFDTLDHEILLAKLQYYGIHGTPLELLKSYLTNRKQYVEIEDTKSKMLDISTGVPQGSILGPLLFIIYVNDFALSSEKFKFVMYADDTTLTSTLETFSTNELNGNPASSINIELNKISEWLKLNRLTLNVQKTKYMLFKTSKKKVQTLLLQMDNKIIDKVLDFNFLGIHFNEQLNWKSHIDKLSVKCCRILGILNRLKRILPLNIKIILYNSLMLPHLNYGITLWGFKCERILK